MEIHRFVEDQLRTRRKVLMNVSVLCDFATRITV